MFEINDGCVCCTVRDGLVAVFEDLAGRMDQFDHVIIETTGLADPGPVMRLFDRATVQSKFMLQGIVTVVDALHVAHSIVDVAACAEQITYADLLIVNKTDTVTEEDLVRTEARLAQLNPLAALIRSQHAQVDVAAVVHSKRRQTGDMHPKIVDHDHSHDHDNQP